jgi:purine catabolism regulator
MPVLSQILAIPELRLAPIVEAQHVDAPDADIRWVATSELADPTPYLEGGEILLTTGLGASGWTTEWDAYAARLARSAIPVLGFGIGLTHAEVPPALVAAARRHGIGLFAVPRETPFIAIGRAVAELIAEAEHRSIAESLAMQRELTRAVIADDGPHRVLVRLARLLDGVAVVVDGEGELLDASDPERGRAVARGAAPDLARIRGQHARDQHGRDQHARGSLADLGPGRSRIIQPLGLSGVSQNHLVVAAESAWSSAQRGSVTTAVALLSLDAQRQSEREETARRVHAGALALILAARPDAADALLALLPGSPRLPSRIQVVRFASDGDVHRLARLLERLAAEHGGIVVGADADGRVAIAAASDTLEEVLHRVAGAGGRAGVGTPSAASDAAASARAAAVALASATAHTPIVRFGELAGRGVVAALGPDAAGSFAAELLRPLLDLPAERDALLATARAFLRLNGQRQPAAAALGIHRNTLRARLDRIEEILGVSLDEPRTRVDLWVALEALPAE